MSLDEKMRAAWADRGEDSSPIRPTAGHLVYCAWCKRRRARRDSIYCSDACRETFLRFDTSSDPSAQGGQK